MVKKASTQQTANESDDEPGPGQPEHAPTEAQRKEVEVLAQYGVKHKSIAAKVGISLLTLRKHYMRELMLGDSHVQALIGQTALRQALGAPAEYYPVNHPDAAKRGKLAKAEVPPSERLLEFFLKTRLGMTPGLHVSTDPYGQPDDLEFNTAGMTNKERIERVAGIFSKVAERVMKSAPPADGKKPTAPGSATRN